MSRDLAKKENNQRAAKRVKTEHEPSPSVVASSATAIVTPDRETKKRSHAVKQERSDANFAKQQTNKKQRTLDGKPSAKVVSRTRANGSGTLSQQASARKKRSIKMEPAMEAMSRLPTTGVLTRSKSKKTTVMTSGMTRVKKTPDASVVPTPKANESKRKRKSLVTLGGGGVCGRIVLFVSVVVLLFGLLYLLMPTGGIVQNDVNVLAKNASNKNTASLFSRIARRKQKTSVRNDSKNSDECLPHVSRKGNVLTKIWRSLTTSTNPTGVTRDSILWANTALN